MISHRSVGIGLAGSQNIRRTCCRQEKQRIDRAGEEWNDAPNDLVTEQRVGVKLRCRVRICRILVAQMRVFVLDCRTGALRCLT